MLLAERSVTLELGCKARGRVRKKQALLRSPETQLPARHPRSDVLSSRRGSGEPRGTSRRKPLNGRPSRDGFMFVTTGVRTELEEVMIPGPLPAWCSRRGPSPAGSARPRWVSWSGAEPGRVPLCLLGSASGNALAAQPAGRSQDLSGNSVSPQQAEC